MIICVCHRVNEQQIAQHVSRGCASFEELQAHTQLGSHCARCVGCAREAFEQARCHAAGACHGQAHCAVETAGAD